MLFDSICYGIKSENVNVSIVEKYNPAIINSCGMNNKRSSFIAEIQNGDFDNTVQKYTKLPFMKKIHKISNRIKNKFRQIICR